MDRVRLAGSLPTGGWMTSGAMKTFLLIVTLAAVLTGLNALKPLHVDDATYYLDAAQIAAYPFDPYGHALLYWSEPLPALHVLAPPVLPYWWASAIWLFGDRPVIWKLWLFPVVLLFVASLAAIIRRFAPTMTPPLLVLIVLSPAFLPSLNFMLDVPALALTLASLVIFFRACGRRSSVLAVLAGLTAGAAMQTKYVAFVAPVLLMAYGLSQRQIGRGLLAGLTAAFVFAAWEAFLVRRYGDSHFLYQIGQKHYAEESKIHVLGDLFPILGTVFPTLALLALLILAAPRWLMLLAAVLALLPFLSLVWPLPVELPGRNGETWPVSEILFCCNGAAGLLSTAVVVWRLIRPWDTAVIVSPFSPQGSLSWFVVLWLGLEIATDVAISPFSAVRRILGIIVAVTLLLGRLAHFSPLGPGRRKALHGLVAVTTLLGLVFFGIDYLEARAEQRAAEVAARRIRERDPHAVTWYAGYWGFQFYAERAGMKQAVPELASANGEPQCLSPSRFHRGDWLVVPNVEVPQQELGLDRPELELLDEVSVGDAVSLSTLVDYYAGSFPLRRHWGPRITVRIFRVKKDFTARLNTS
jgi:hypothetical protein